LGAPVFSKAVMVDPPGMQPDQRTGRDKYDTHCTCSKSPLPMMPPGTLQEWDSSADSWRTVTYDSEGGGTDFLSVVRSPDSTWPLGAGTASSSASA
jgi:hypothetical protein